MSKRKRDITFLLEDEAPDLHIKVTDRKAPIPAHSLVLRPNSKLAKEFTTISGTPTVWDLSNVLLSGDSQPIKGAVVEQWLDFLYARVGRARRVRLPSNLVESRPLLRFADYTGTIEVVLSDIARVLIDDPQLSLTVPVGDQPGRCVDLLLRGKMYYVSDQDELRYADIPTQGSGFGELLPAAEFRPHREQFASALCSLLEEWLHLAGRLGLVPLVELLLEFVRRLLFPSTFTVCLPYAGNIFSPRVLQEMPTQLLFEAFLRQNLCCPTTDAIMEAKDVKVELLTPEALSWFGNAHDLSRSLVPDSGGQVALLKQPNVSMHVKIAIGGLHSGTGEPILRKALSDALQHTEAD